MAAHPFRTAWETHDLSVLVAVLAPDVVVRSPILSEPFRGRETVAELYEVVFDVVHGLEFTGEFEGDGTHAFFWRAEIEGWPIEGADLLRGRPGGEIDEITVMARPLAGAAALASAAGPAVARRRGRLNAVAMTLLGKPLPRLVALGDRVGTRLSRRRG